MSLMPFEEGKHIEEVKWMLPSFFKHKLYKRKHLNTCSGESTCSGKALSIYRQNSQAFTFLHNHTVTDYYVITILLW